MTVLRGREFVDALTAAGIIPDGPSRVRRVVIDAPARGVVVVHVEHFGDERILGVVPALSSEGVRIERGECRHVGRVELTSHADLERGVKAYKCTDCGVLVEEPLRATASDDAPPG